MAYFIRDRVDDLHSLQTHLWFLPLFVGLWGTILYYTGMYASFRLKRMKEILFLIYQAAYLGFFVFAGVCYACRIEHISRAFVFLSFLLAMALLSAEKVIHGPHLPSTAAQGV